MSNSSIWVFYYHEVDRKNAGDIKLIALNQKYGNTKDVLDKEVTDKIVRVFLAKKFDNNLKGVEESLNWLKGHLKVMTDPQYSQYFLNHHVFFINRADLPEKITKEVQHLKIRQKVLPNFKIQIGDLIFEDSKFIESKYIDSLFSELSTKKVYKLIKVDKPY